MTKEKVFKKKSSILEWGKAIVIAVILALLIRNFLFEPYVVEGKSMD
ncbi:S26 family signal peptidase, partial [Bacillus subtilis]